MMHRQACKIRIPYLPLSTFCLLGALSLGACETDLKEVDRIANIKKEEAVDISKNIKVIYSDSSRVKAELTSPELRISHDSLQTYEFKKGIQIIFFDEQTKETQRITSNYAIQRVDKKTTEFKNNVIVTMIDGTVIKTEELIYDEAAENFYNNQPIQAFFKDNRGNLQGSSFTSDKDFKRVNIQNSTGIYYIQNSSAFPKFSPQ